MAESAKLLAARVPWRELPAWLGLLVAVIGIFLTYSEIRTANERELVFRIWDEAHKLRTYSVELPAASSKEQEDVEMRLLHSIHAHAGLLDDRSLMKAAVAVSRAWSAEHLAAAREDGTEATSEFRGRPELTCEIDKMIDAMEVMLGTYRPDPFWASFDQLPCSASAEPPND